MFASRTAAVARTGTRLSARRVAGTRVCQRLQSTSSVQTSNSSGHIISGLTGGAVVLLGGYAWYHFSGTKNTVQTANSVNQYYQETKNSIAAKAPKNPNEVLNFLRSTAKSYASMIPGAGSYVDETFDAIDHLRETHGEEFDKILQETYNEISDVLKDVKDKGLQGMDAATASKVMSVATKRVSQLNELGKKVGGDAFQKLEERYPQVASTLGSSYTELRDFAERSGPEAKKLVADTTSQIQDIMSKSKSTPDALNRARELAQEKAQQLKEMVWDNAAKEADANPEVKELLSKNKAAFIAAGSSLTSMSDVVQRVRDVAKGNFDKEKVKELTEYVQEQAKGAQSRGWEGLQSWVKSMPGGEEALKNLSDVDIQALMALTKEKSGDAKKLAEETYRDVLSVLKEKADKAKKIADEGKKEAKEKS